MRPSSLYWQEIPAVRLVLPLLAGGYLYIALSERSFPLELVVLGILLGTFGAFFKKAWPFFFFLILLLAGYFHFHQHDQALARNNQFSPDSTYQQLITLETLRWDSLKNRWRGKAESLVYGADQQKITLYYWMERRDSSQILKSGDQILGEFSFRSAREAEIPGAFDFGRYLRHRNISHTLYIPSYDKYVHKNKGNTAWIGSLSSWRNNKMQEIGLFTNTLTQSLLQAILFGNSQALPTEVRAQFADAGMAHILAVSGMHVGILVLIVQFVVSRVYKRAKAKEQIKFICIIGAVWLYVALCEFAPSATRAAIMVSIYYLGKACKLPAVGINTLALSALVIFLWDPFMLLDLGAQLSFAAMLGILFTLSFWEQLLLRFTPLPTSWVSLLALSFAAQVGVGPLLLYHFGHIPLLFWLFSIPAGYLAVFLFAGGWTLVVCTEISSFCATYIGRILDFGLYVWTQLMNQIAQFGLPQFTWRFFPTLYLLLTLTLVVLFIRLYYSSTKRQLFRRMKALPVLLTFFIILHFYHQTRTEIAVFPHKKQNYTLVKSKQKAFILGESKWQPEDPREEVFDQIHEAYPIQEWEYTQVHSVHRVKSE